MKLIVSYIDHHMAGLEARELFTFSGGQTEEIYRRILEEPGIRGAVLLTTCNRTEVYLSAEDDTDPEPMDVFCRAAQLDGEEARAISRTLKGEDAFRHLCRLTAGAESQLWGDSQIITQVGQAIDEARECEASDAVLNTAFRIGITAGKTIRTHVDLHIHDDSTAARAASKIRENPQIRSCLVIGNGMIGRLVAAQLVRDGIDTKMTLRRYRHGEVMIPAGVETVEYEKRYQIMEDCDAVISATASPHFVVTEQGLRQVENTPRLLIDMAVPRDIEPEVSRIPGVTVCNIDDISEGHHIDLQSEQSRRLERFIDSYADEFRRWDRFRKERIETVRRIADPEEKAGTHKYFPVFIDSSGKYVVVIGGGVIAERRIMTLTEFDFRVHVVAEEVTDTIRQLAEAEVITWKKGSFQESDLEGADIVAACTDKREVNHAVGEWCRQRGVQVSVCDARSESTFWFPAIAINDELTMGLVGNGKRHDIVKRAASALRRIIEERSYEL